MRWTACILVAAIGVIGWLVAETRRLAQMVGEQEIAAAAARQAAAAAEVRAAAAVAAGAPAPVPSASAPMAAAEPLDPVAYSQLRLELQATKAQLDAATALLEQRNQVEAARVEQQRLDAERATAPIPEGVRQGLKALQALLRAEGFRGPRFLRAERIGPNGIEGIEMLDVDGDGIDVAFVQAERMTAKLDRATGDFELRFHGGWRSVAGVREPLPKDGHALVFRGVDGRAVEAALPYLVQAEGAYAQPATGTARDRSDLDPLTRRQWLARLDRLLVGVKGQPSWRVNRLRGLRDGWFLDVELVGVDDKNRVVAGAHIARLAIEVDPATATVSLHLQDGVLRRAGVESSITGEGYRMFLPELTVKQATDAMFGMVVTK